MLAVLRRLGERCSDLSEQYIPDPYVIAIVLTFVAVAAALATGAGPQRTMTAWTNGVWSLLPFMAAISILLMTGDAIAKSPTFTRGLERLARLPDSRFAAVWFTSFVAMAAAIVSWAIGLIVGAIMAKRVAYECREKDIKVHYPLLAAAGYTSLMVFHGGLSSSVGLMMADPSLIPATFPEYAREGIPLALTVGSTANIVTTGTLLVVIPIVMGLLHPKEGEIKQLPRTTYKEIDRLVIDPLTELRSLLPDDFQFRRNISSLFNELSDRTVTTLCTAQPADEQTESDLHFLSNTAITLQYKTDQRTLEVSKYRGSGFATGRHTYRIHAGTGGHVYPKLVPGDHEREHDRTQLPSDLDALDTLLGGGLERGSVTVISGPSGVGKTTTGSYFLQAAAARDERALAYLFEELRTDYLYRSTQLGMQVEQFVDEGVLEVEEIESLTKSPDEFAYYIREAVENRGVEFVMIDGTAGYRQSLRGDDSPEQLTRELHALCRYLKRMGVTVILIEEISTITGEFTPTTNQISYLADNLVFLRYLEVDGELRKAIGVLKKRYSGFETALRGLSIDTDGIHIGEPLSGHRGILTGVAETAASADE